MDERLISFVCGAVCGILGIIMMLWIDWYLGYTKRR